MKKVPLSNGEVTLVSDEDYELVMQWKWKKSRHGYATRCIYVGDGKFSALYLHILIAGKVKGKTVDHENTDKLDNQRHNLLHVSKSRNNRNKGKPKTNTSGFLNVSKSRKRWRAYYKLNNKFHSLGTYDTPEEAYVVAEAKRKELLNATA